jgi:two-component system, chemotaxis family, sensor kinase CheA
MNALHEQFIVEARELIQQATDDLIGAEREGLSDELIDRVFRVFHTLKGSAAVVDLKPMGLTMHAAEDVLIALQVGRLGATAAVVDQMLACLDQVSGWVDDFETAAALPPLAGNDAREMAESLRYLLAGAVSMPSSAAVVHEGDHLPPDWVKRLIDIQPKIISSAAQAQDTPLFALHYEPRNSCFFDGDDPLALMRRIPRLLAFQIEPRDAWPPLTEFDPFSCNLRLLAISAAGQTELDEIFRLVPDQVRIVPITPPKPTDEGERGDKALLYAVIEEQRQMLGASKESEGLTGRVGSAARVSANALRYSDREERARAVDNAGAAAIAQKNVALLVAVLDEALQKLSATTVLANDGSEHIETDRPAPVRSAGRGLRVDESKIDALVDLAGELLVVKNGLAHLAKRTEQEASGSEVAHALRDQYGAIERIAVELHAAILQLRMVPVAQVFRSFSRVVRDVSQRLNKNVNLVTRGEMTEADKTIVDLLFEPLMHLVRNALDHGIETPEERRRVGKPEAGILTLNAARVGDRFAVEVIDDGRGIDPSVIRNKAAERSLLAADELATLSDEEALNLIFLAGFSTASEVSDISGRGVGMDVVRDAIERVGGRVSLKSQVGGGTTVSLDLPMNIALVHIMVVEAGGQVFGIPMDAVSETVRLSPDRITRIKNNEGFVLHERVVPICSLAGAMGLAVAAAPGNNERLAVVAEVGGKVAGLEVDAVRDRIEVVLKPMQGLLTNARGYAGTTLLGNGAVLLVLDLKEILP